jgi:hypothetical protein
MQSLLEFVVGLGVLVLVGLVIFSVSWLLTFEKIKKWLILVIILIMSVLALAGWIYLLQQLGHTLLTGGAS